MIYSEYTIPLYKEFLICDTLQCKQIKMDGNLEFSNKLPDKLNKPIEKGYTGFTINKIFNEEEIELQQGINKISFLSVPDGIYILNFVIGLTSSKESDEITNIKLGISQKDSEFTNVLSLNEENYKLSPSNNFTKFGSIVVSSLVFQNVNLHLLQLFYIYLFALQIQLLCIILDPYI